MDDAKSSILNGFINFSDKETEKVIEVYIPTTLTKSLFEQLSYAEILRWLKSTYYKEKVPRQLQKVYTSVKIPETVAILLLDARDKLVEKKFGVHVVPVCNEPMMYTEFINWIQEHHKRKVELETELNEIEDDNVPVDYNELKKARSKLRYSRKIVNMSKIDKTFAMMLAVIHAITKYGFPIINRVKSEIGDSPMNAIRRIKKRLSIADMRKVDYNINKIVRDIIMLDVQLGNSQKINISLPLVISEMPKTLGLDLNSFLTYSICKAFLSQDTLFDVKTHKDWLEKSKYFVNKFEEKLTEIISVIKRFKIVAELAEVENPKDVIRIAKKHGITLKEAIYLLPEEKVTEILLKIDNEDEQEEFKLSKEIRCPKCGYNFDKPKIEWREENNVRVATILCPKCNVKINEELDYFDNEHICEMCGTVSFTVTETKGVWLCSDCLKKQLKLH